MLFISAYSIEQDHNSQLVVLVRAHNQIESLVQRSELLRYTLPGVPSHDHCVHRPLGCVRRDALEVRHLLWQPPRQPGIPSDAVVSRGGDNDCEASHNVWGRRCSIASEQL